MNELIDKTVNGLRVNEGNRSETMAIQTSEIVQALISYAGPLDDPRIGWLGRSASRHGLFQCERCRAEHEDCTKIDHKPGCSAAALLAVMQALRA
jgi:hypothetical protein